MARYFAKINELGEVEKFVVADSKQWLTEKLGGKGEGITKIEIDKKGLVYYSAFIEKLYLQNKIDKK